MKEFPPFRLDIADHCLWRDGQRVPITPKAFAVLQYLVERAGRLVTQNELLDALWPDAFVQPEVLKSQILDVRAALGDRPKDPLFIETISRKGYRFIAAVRDSALAESFAPVARKLVGRDTSIAELRACLSRASIGERQIVFITGEQGMGKTTLVEAFLEELRGSRIQIARGQCLEGYGGAKEPYYCVLEALGQVSRGSQGESLGRILESHAPTWLVQLPALLKRAHHDTLRRELVGATRERMIREICDALEKLVEETTYVFLLEDLHWTDHPTVDLLAALAHRRSRARLLLIGTYRPVDIVLAQHPLKPVSHSLKAHGLSREIALAPLADGEVGEFLSRQASGADPGPGAAVEHLARWIRKQTDGNPLFMVTLIEHLAHLGHITLKDAGWTVAAPLDQIEVSVPETLRQMIEMQIDQLSAQEQVALEAGSVHGIAFPGDLTAGALEMDTESVENALQKLTRQNHMVRTASMEELPDGTFSQRYEFVHAVFRHVFYHRLAPARRAKLHRRFGEAIESRHSKNRAEVAAELAGHFERCGDWIRAVDYLWLAAKNAWQRFDYREGISILEQALQAARRLPEADRIRAELRTRQTLAVIQHALHDTARVVPTLEALAAGAKASGMPEVEARALVALATLRANDDCGECLPLLDRLQGLKFADGDAAAQAQTRAQDATLRITVLGWDARLAEEHVAGLARVQELGDRFTTAAVLLDRSFIQWVSSQYAESIQSAQKSMPVLLESGRLVRYLHGRDLVATNLVFLGQWGEALDIFDDSIDNARKNEAPHRLIMPLLFKAWLHLNAMDYRSVSDMCAAALPALTGPYILDRKYLGLRLAASAELGLGNHELAALQLRELLDQVERRPVMLSWYWRIPLQLDLTEACLAKGDLAQARTEADASLAVALRTAERTWQGLAWELSARVALQEEDIRRAESNVRNALDAIHGIEVPLAAWRVHATAFKLYRSTSNAELARLHLDSSKRIVQSLADSLDSRPALQQTFLSSPLVLNLGV